jgi:sugar transferase (PEP-CTERM/EpsH1 system associated)
VHILWLKTELLHPVDKGGKIRSFNMLRELRREHRVTYIALDEESSPDAIAAAHEYCDELVRVPFRSRKKRTLGFYAELLGNMASPLPYAVQKYSSPAMRQAIRELSRDARPDVIVCDFLFPAVNVPAALEQPTVLFQHNVEATIWERHAAVASNPVVRAYFKGQWRRMRAFERAQCRRFDRVVAVSPEDREAMRRDYGAEQVSDVATGVDVEYFRRSPGSARRPHRLVFTGSMDWMPNEDGVVHFATAILPRIREAVPEVTFAVVGRNPSPRVVELARRDDSIEVTGSVPDVRPYIEEASAFVVPLRIGGGTRLKIFEAMAMECALVSTTVGAEGLPLEHERDLLIADDDAQFAASVVRLLRDDAQAKALGRRGAALARRDFGWDRVAASFAAICQGACAEHRSPILAGI